MPAISFEKQFVGKIKSNEKRQTIRSMRNRPFKVGDRLYLFSGLRTKKCERIGESNCIEVRDIKIGREDIIVDGEKITRYEKLVLATNDGFASENEMMEWFDKKHGLPFVGQIIFWDKCVSKK